MPEASLPSRRSGEKLDSNDFIIACPPAVDYHTSGGPRVLDFFLRKRGRGNRIRADGRAPTGPRPAPSTDSQTSDPWFGERGWVEACHHLDAPRAPASASRPRPDNPPRPPGRSAD